MSITGKSTAPEICGAETSALQSISGVTRRVKKSEAIDGSHVRCAAIPCWTLVSTVVTQHERYDAFVDTRTVKVFLLSMARQASHRHTVHGHR